jgi:3D-(3,5/4)-trihydroxycyclohexane-1,2-dione acylhydrolase (decyclizing)
LAGGGVRFSGASAALTAFAEAHGMPVAATQAGKSVMPEAHPNYVGSLGVTGSSAANHLAEHADVVLSVGSRLQDFTTGSNGLIKGDVISLNVQLHDAIKHDASTVLGDALVGIEALEAALSGHRTDDAYSAECASLKADWNAAIDAAMAPPAGNALPSDGAVINAVNRNVPETAIAVGAAGSMPGELHKLWRTGATDGYHMEYGFSCMGYEVAAGIGVYMAAPNRPNIVFAGDGSYLMMNSELATAVMMGITMTLIITDNRGFACINRLQAATGGAAFNNLLVDAHHEVLPNIDFAAHAASLGARAQKVASVEELGAAVAVAAGRDGVDVIVIDTDPAPSTEAGGTWWDVAVPEVSARESVKAARASYMAGRKRQSKGDA